MLPARSMRAFAVSCWIAYSLETAVASWKASSEVARCSFSISTFFDIVTITFTSLAPSEPRSLNTLCRAFMFPFSRICSNTNTIASTILPAEYRRLMVPGSMLNSFSIRLCFVWRLVMNLLNAVEATSGIKNIESAADPKPKSWSVVIPAVRAIPVSRFENSTILPAVAVEVAANWNIAEPVANIDFSTPIFGIRPITSVIFERAVSASAPRSSFRATFTWLAARVKPSSPSIPYFAIPSFAPA